jgi:AcrR family transcriptional regulator
MVSHVEVAMQSNSVEGRKRVLEAAAEVFQRDGYQTATMARVADAAGVSKGLPYHYYEGKEALARAVVSSHLDEVLAVLAHWPEGPADERLRWFIGTALEHARARGASYRLYLSLALQPTTRALVLEEVERRREALATLDEKLSAIFVALGHPEPETEALVVRATVDGLIQYLLLAGERFPLDDAVTRVMALHGRSAGGSD